MRRVLILLPIFMSVQCMKARHTAELPSSTLGIHPTFTVSLGQVVCAAQFFKLSDPSQTPVILESEAVVACNSTPMTQSSQTYSTSLLYQYGSRYTITVVRATDGASLVASQIVY